MCFHFHESVALIRGELPALPWSAWVTRAGWSERKQRFLASVKSIYTLAKLRKHLEPWSLPQFKVSRLRVILEQDAAQCMPRYITLSSVRVRAVQVASSGKFECLTDVPSLSRASQPCLRSAAWHWKLSLAGWSSAYPKAARALLHICDL